MEAGCGAILGIVIFMAAWIAMFLFAGCKRTEYVTIEKVVHTTDTMLRVQTLRDTAHVRDSIFLREETRGDTVRITTERWHTAYRERVTHDTVYASRTDSVRVPQPYPVVKEVKMPLRWWQKLLMWLGAAVMVGGVLHFALRK